jgi:hypothetical protein
MSNLEFITPLGSLPTKYYKITNPMGIHPYSKTGPEALSIPGQRWVNSNRQPLLIKFSTLPATLIEGFQFSVPQSVGINPFAALPARWRMEASYDGRQWYTYHTADSPEIFSSYVSPVYKFSKEI